MMQKIKVLMFTVALSSPFWIAAAAEARSSWGK